jgi:hypothetical protein
VCRAVGSRVLKMLLRNALPENRFVPLNLFLLVSKGEEIIVNLMRRSYMRLMHRFAMLLLPILPCDASAQYAHLRLKAENSMVISWDGVSSDPNENQITISDTQGHPLTTLNVLRPVQDARRVSIYDVSAQGNLIAVAGVYENKEGNHQVHPVASLLLFDFSGRLLSALP